MRNNFLLYFYNKKNKNRSKIIIFAFFCILTFLPGFSCDTEIKNLNDGEFDLGLDTFNTPNNNFRISFALRDSTDTTKIQIQGDSSSNSAILATCGSNGANCICEFFTDIGASDVAAQNTTSNTQYEKDGNYITCNIPSSVTASTIKAARVRNSSESRYTNLVDIVDSVNDISLDQILGGLEAAKVRSIFRYGCRVNYLKKTNTTTTSFDCTDQGADDFSILQINYNYYLFADNATSNFNEDRSLDIFYNDGSGDLCNAFIKQIDCTTEVHSALANVIATDRNSTNGNAIIADFGLYAEEQGIFTQSITLTSGSSTLGGLSQSYGFAAPAAVDESCPPGLELRKAFNASSTEETNTNVVNLTDVVIAASAPNTMKKLEFNIVTGVTRADCNGTTCTAPDLSFTTASAAETSISFSQDTTVPNFCVIPCAKLPNSPTCN